MNTKLTLGEKLKDLREKNGYKTLKSLEKALNHQISSSSLGNYENVDNEQSDVSAFNIAKLAKFYGVSTDYLLGFTDQPERPESVYDELHLSDKMIEVLKDEKINHLLLMELLTHPEFKKMIIDSEVYVDKIAESNFQFANVILSYARDVVIGKTGDEIDLAKRTLELGQVDMEKFVLSAIHDDIDVMLKDIRKKHEKDESTVKVNEVLQQFMKQTEEVLKIVSKGEPSTYDDVLTIYCHVLQVNEVTISKEDRKIIKGFFMKSPQIRKALNQRGKTKKNYR